MAVVRKFQNSFTSGVLTPGVLARVDLDKYSAGCEEIVNGIVYAYGGVSNRPGTMYVDEVPGDGILIPFVYSVEQAYVLCFYDPAPSNADRHKAAMRIYRTRDDGTPAVVNVTISGDDMPYYSDELTKLKFAQSADTMFLVHPSHKPHTLTRSGDTSWAFSEIVFMPRISAPTGLTLTKTGFTGDYTEETIEYKVSAVNESEQESVPSAAASIAVKTTWSEGSRVHLTWSPVVGAIRYEVYKNARGYFAYIGKADDNEFTDDNIEGDGTIGPKMNRDPFDSENNYPGAVGIFQQRLVFGRTNNEPQTVWMTEIGSLDSLAVAEPLRDDSAITVTVDSKQMNEIRHFIPLRDMIMLTSGAEFKVSSGARGGAITPTNVSFDIQSYWGSSNVPPIVSGTTVITVQNSGRVVRDIYYKLEEDGYSGSEVSVLAEHLLNSPVRDWAYQQDPFSTIYLCLENGRLLTLTYMREQKVMAWAEHESGGAKFRSVSAIRERDGKDNVYFLVERNGKYFVEFQMRRDYGDDVRNAFFVDCGLTFNGGTTAVTTLSGLEHLAGKEVAVLADGSPVLDIVVSAGGTITLPQPASMVTVGLPYETRIKTLDPDIRADNGATLGLPKVVSRVTLMLRETRDVKIGPSDAQLVELKLPVPKKYGVPPELFTGKISTTLTGAHRPEANLVIKHTTPLPMTVLGLVSEVSMG